jgi:hypothetical protein
LPTFSFIFCPQTGRDTDTSHQQWTEAKTDLELIFERKWKKKGILGGADKPDKEGNKLQQPNSGVIQHTLHKAQYTS